MMQAANHRGFRALATKNLLHWMAVVAVLAGFIGSAGATAIYSAAAKSTFTLDPVGPVTSITLAPPFTSTSTTGTGVATIDTYAASASGIHPATIDSKVSGSAVAPPTSMSSAEAKNGHVFEVNRTSPSGPLPTVTMAFTFVIDWETHLARDLPGTEFARGGAFFGISGFETGIDSIVLDPGMPGMLVVHGAEIGWEFNPLYDTGGGSPVDELHHLVVTGSITVLAGMVGEFSVITDTAGFAAAIPEPATAPLLMLPLTWFALKSRRRSARG